MKRLFYTIIRACVGIAPRFIVRILYGDIWKLHQRIRMCGKRHRVLSQISLKYWESFGSWVGPYAIIETPPIFPHGPMGFFVSNGAHIGKGCVIFQHVTIGSNTLEDSSRRGAPHIDDNVYIGCGAKIIGNVHVGRNARIGANCVVVKNVPPNSVTVIRGIESISKDYELNNTYISASKDIIAKEKKES